VLDAHQILKAWADGVDESSMDVIASISLRVQGLLECEAHYLYPHARRALLTWVALALWVALVSYLRLPGAAEGPVRR
jgi:hypothetical protein